MTTVAEIAADAFDGVAAEITDVILSATITKSVPGPYDIATGTYAEAMTDYSGRAVVATETPVTDYFPEYVVGPSDVLVFLEGFQVAPAEGDDLSLSGHDDRVIRSVGDIVGVGTFFAVVAR